MCRKFELNTLRKLLWKKRSLFFLLLVSDEHDYFTENREENGN